MDERTKNPAIPTPNPVITQATAVSPTISTHSSAFVATSASHTTPTMSTAPITTPVTPTPTAPVTPAVRNNPAIAPTVPTAAQVTTSTTPTINPTMASTVPTLPPVPQAGIVNPPVTPSLAPIPVTKAFEKPNSFDVFAATDPFTRPEPAPEPDPIEEELKAPLKAAGPVPGSIGSAISGPSAGGPVQSASLNYAFGTTVSSTPNVSFTDPALAAVPKSNEANTGKKPVNKKTLIILGTIAGVIVFALVAVLILQVVGII